MKTKKCSRCGEEKELTYFTKQNGGKFGVRASCKECLKQYRKQNKQIIQYNKEYNKQYFQENKEKFREWSKEYYHNNKEKVQAWNKKYQQTEKGKEANRKGKRKYRARLNKVFSQPYTNETMIQYWKETGIEPHICFYCKTKPFEEVDHFYPISKGGWDIPSNLVPSCKSCNCSKGAKLPTQFILERLDFWEH